MSTVKFNPKSISTVLELKDYPGSKINIRTDISVGERRQVMEKYKDLKENDPKATDALIDMLTKAINSWNFTTEDEEGKEIPLPIDSDTLNQFGNNDVELMLKTMGVDLGKEKTDAEKKA